jgi:hypothetical protein
MAHAKTVVEILNLSLNKVAEVKNLYPINNKGMILRYSKELSDYGSCTFRISTKDTFFTQFGDVIKPHVNHVRIRRAGTVVWSGAIVDNPQRNKNFIEVVAYEYDFYLDKVLIRRDAEVTAGDGKDNYRTFNSGTMAAAVTDLVTKAKTDFGSTHPMSTLNIAAANIENPDYPLNFTNESGVALTGGWTFTSFINLQFDYHTVYYVLKAFGVYTSSDFEIDENLNFYFKKFVGNKQTGITFRYGTQGNVVDYNTPRLGKRMVNDYWGIAADTNGKILHANLRDTTAYNTYGLLQGTTAYSDVKDHNMLKSRMNEELQFLKSPDDSPVNVLLNEKAYPLGQYGIGDIVTVKIRDNIIDYEQARRIVGITVTVHNTGREMVVLQTNLPKAKDAAGA